MRDQNSYNEVLPSTETSATRESRVESVDSTLEALVFNKHESLPQLPLRTPLPESPSRELTSHRTVPVHTLVQSETGVSIHGPASAFFEPLSMRSLPSGLSVPTDSPVSIRNQQQTDDEIRRELFAYSALEFQKEYTYMSERKLDLDGVDWETADHLFQLHWNLHHLGFLITYRPAIMHSLATGGPHCNKLLLNAIYYTAALQSSRPNMRDDPAHPQYFGTKFFHRFQSLLASELQRSSTASIAALVLMGSSCVSNGRQTIGWLYAGLSYQMIVDLGLHVDPDKVQMSSLVPSKPPIPMTAVDIEIQRRYIWGAYLNDRFQSLYFGRPPSLRMIEGVEASQTVLDDYEELELWKPYIDPTGADPPVNFTPQPARAVSTRAALVRLAEITDQIIESFYTPKSGRMSTEEAHCGVQRLQHQLDLWAETLPVHLRYEPGDLPVPPAIRFNLQYVVTKPCNFINTMFLGWTIQNQANHDQRHPAPLSASYTSSCTGPSSATGTSKPSAQTNPPGTTSVSRPHCASITSPESTATPSPCAEPPTSSATPFSPPQLSCPCTRLHQLTRRSARRWLYSSGTRSRSSRTAQISACVRPSVSLAACLSAQVSTSTLCR